MLHYRHNNFYAPNNSQLKGLKAKKTNNKETDTTAFMLYSLKRETGYERPNKKRTNKKKV